MADLPWPVTRTRVVAPSTTICRKRGRYPSGQQNTTVWLFNGFVANEPQPTASDQKLDSKGDVHQLLCMGKIIALELGANMHNYRTTIRE